MLSYESLTGGRLQPAGNRTLLFRGILSKADARGPRAGESLLRGEAILLWRCGIGKDPACSDYAKLPKV
jgi:hypothetical protein